MRELTLQATVDNIETVTDFVNEYLDEVECSLKVQMQIAVVIDEIFSNIAHYAYTPSVGDVTVSVMVNKETKVLMLSFADSGVAYNPLVKEDPDVTLSAEERQIGGMGIFMVKKLMDDITYEYVEGRNVLTIWKKL